jgi:hypothetical protein
MRQKRLLKRNARSSSFIIMIRMNMAPAPGKLHSGALRKENLRRSAASVFLHGFLPKRLSKRRKNSLNKTRNGWKRAEKYLLCGYLSFKNAGIKTRMNKNAAMGIRTPVEGVRVPHDWPDYTIAATAQ